MRSTAILVLLCSCLVAAGAAESVDLINPQKPTKGWTFNDGREFPGAKGSFTADDSVQAQRLPCLRIDGDFTGGGRYVSAGCDLPKQDIEALSFWLKAPQGTELVSMRLIDGSGQCHQFQYAVEPSGEWQRVLFPVARYFAAVGTSASVPEVKRYEGWGGAKDGKWHGPGRHFHLVLPARAFGESKQGSFWISGLKAQLAPKKMRLTKELRLDDFLRAGELGWNFVDGREFPGAKGELVVVGKENDYALQMSGDFTGGGAYVAMHKNLDGLDLQRIKLQIKTPNAKHITVRLIDGTGQCHQSKGFKLNPDDAWHEVVIDPDKIAGGEHWGGAKDGKWHGNAKGFSIIIGKDFADDRKPQLQVRDIRADVTVTSAVAGEPYAEGFDGQGLPRGWSVTAPQGAVGIARDGAFAGKGALRVARSEEQLTEEVAVVGASFPAAAGPWNLAGATRSALNSPDNSFAMRVHIEYLDDGGNVLDRRTLVDQTKEQHWRPFNRQITMPQGTTQARFTVTVHKTFGWMELDALQATPLADSGKEQVVDRIVISADATGHLFYPEDPVALQISVQAPKPLPTDGRTVIATVTDYWGAEQFAPASLTLTKAGVVDQRFVYNVVFTRPKEDFAIGRYYELHVRWPSEEFEEASEYSAFARLPKNESYNVTPDELPFTIRSWDGRIKDYFYLAARLGHRNIGLWGQMSPGKPNLPGIDDMEKLGAKWLTGTPASTVERQGWTKFSREDLATGVRAFMEKYAQRGLRAVCIGNEPNENPAKMAEKVEAYKIVYETIKEVDPNIFVIATSVPALHEFWELGFHKYADAFDFHVYETYEGVRKQIRKYKALMKEYGIDKPIWSTEIGLNSQGQTRHAVAKELVKKITAFFAEGGVNVSWFGIMYPDRDGKARGTSGNAHNVFDCQYMQYNPRLDAIMYYWMINDICTKPFVDEVQHDNGVQAYLFRDDSGDCFQVLWREDGRLDVSLPLPGVQTARLLRIDGSSTQLTPVDGQLSVGVGPEPVMLRYQGGPATLPTTLGQPRLTIADQDYSILKGDRCEVLVQGADLAAADLAVQLPPRWTATIAQHGADAVLTVVAPAETNARVGRLIVQRVDGQAIHGDITIDLVIKSPIAVEVYAAHDADDQPALRMVVTNNGAEAKTVDYVMELLSQHGIKEGAFALNTSDDLSAYLKGASEGRLELAGGASSEVLVTVAEADRSTVFRAKAAISDEIGRSIVFERWVGGFAQARKATVAPRIDGRLDDPVWQHAMTMRIGEQRQFRAMKNQIFDEQDTWHSPEDLSASWRAAWDAEHLYLAVEVTDDAHVVSREDGGLWNQDGLQFLFDTARLQPEKPGKYDISIGKGTKGEQGWVHLSGHSSVPTGNLEGLKMTVTDLPGSAGGKIYEMAIPWSTLAPFKPVAGANLGMSMILNEDDGKAREGFLGWFSGVHSKQLDQAGDLILVD